MLYPSNIYYYAQFLHLLIQAGLMFFEILLCGLNTVIVGSYLIRMVRNK